MSEWIEFAEDWPVWRGGGRNIEIMRGNNRIRGELVIDDSIHDGEDEIPIFMIKICGCSCSLDIFADHDRWRFCG